MSALGKLCDVHAERFPSSRAVLESHWLPRLPLTSDNEESIAVTSHLCDMLEKPNRTQLVMGTSFESLGRILHIFCTVVTSDRRKGLCNKTLRGRITKLLQGMKSAVPAQVFQGAVAQLPSNMQQMFQ